MEKLTQILSHKTTRLMIWVLILFIPIIFLWQDGDLTDTGYHVSVYHFFFERLSQSYTESLFFLSAFVGGSFYYLLPEFGVLGIKILSLLFFAAILLLAHSILRKKFNNNPWIPLLLLCSIIFGFRSFPIIFNYDLFTTFWLMLLMFLLMDIKNISPMRMFFSGIISFLMVLSLFTNIVYLALYPVLFWLFSNTTKSIKIRNITYFFLGFMAGLVLFISSSLLFNIEHIFIEQLKSFALLSNESSSYNLLNLLTLYVVDFLILIGYTAVVAVFIKSINFLSLKLKLNYGIQAFLLISGFIVLSSYPFLLNYSNHVKYVVPAVFINLLLIFRPQKSEYYFLGLILISALTQVAGTNTGFTLKLSFILIFAIPYLILLGITTENFRNKVLGWSYACFTFIYSLFLLISGYYGVGFGLFERFEFNQNIEVAQYNGLKTNLNQKVKIESLYKSIVKFQSNHEQLFIFGHIPMFYYLSDLPPTTEVYWLAGNKPERISEIIQSIPNRENTLIFEQKNLTFLTSNTEEFHNFMRHHGYSVLEDSEEYRIWSNR